MTEENIQACKFINEARALRQKYFGGSCDCITGDNLGDDGVTFAFGNEGIVELFHPERPGESLCTVPTIDDFYVDYKRLSEIVSDGAMRSYAFQRLQLLSSAFKMHVTANGAVESKEQSNLLGTDFYRELLKNCAFHHHFLLCFNLILVLCSFLLFFLSRYHEDR